jgi:E3 ubiquitin-protein ligase HUWE1
VIATIPYALGALCLNQAGTDYALSRPRLIHLLVNSPSNLAYREVLRERENAMYLGSSLDELVRHHPALKPVLHEALRDMLRNVAAMGQVGRFAGVSKVSDYKLIPDSLQRSAEEKDETPSSTEDLELPSAPDGTEKNMDVVITLTAQLMCGLFQNPQFAKDFLEQGGLSLVLNLYELPCLVSQFATTDTARHLNNVLRNLAQAELAKVLEGIIEAVRTAMAQVSFIWKRDLDTSGVISLGLLHPKSANDLESANTQFRRLAYLNNLLGLLGTFYHSASYALGKIAATFLQVLGASKSSIFLSNLGKLHRVCLLENIWCKCNESPQRPKPASISKTQSLEEAVLSPMVEFSASDLALSHTSSDSIGHPTDAVVKNPISDQTVDASKMPENYSSVRYMFSRIPLHIMPIFQGIIRLLQLRKADPAHKAHSVPTADLVAAIMVEHLESAANLPKTIEAGGYAFTITGLISSYLCGDPNGNGTLQTMLLIAFQKKGGIIALRSRLQQQLDSIGDERRAILELSSKDAPTLLRAFAGIKVIFDLVKTLVSAEALQKAPQTLTLVSKDKEPDHEDYFSPLELLIKIRLDLADPIWATFQAAWLQDCPLAIVQAVSKAALSLAQPVSALASYFASGSDATPASSTGTAGTLSSTLATLGFPTSRSSRSDGQADSTYSDMLVDMGFSRGAANAALISCGNVFPSAAYYVIQHGHVLDQMQRDGGSIESASATASTTDQSGPPAVGAGETAPSAIPASTSPKVALKAVAAGRRSHLEQRQKKYLAALPTRAVELIEAHNELSFIFGPALLDVQGAVDVIMQGIKELQPDATNRDVKLQARLQLFAILAHQPTFGASLDRTKATEYVDVLQNLLGSTTTPRPRWVAANLLAMECIIMWGSESIELQPSGDSIPETIRTGPLHKVVRSRLLNYCTSLLQEKDLSEDELLAVLRSLVFLTRDKELLRPFLEQSGLHSLFQSVYSTPLKRRHAGMALSTIICRHFAEDGAVLQQCMQREIQAWFSKPRTTPTTAKHFVSNLRAVALRDPDVFLRAAKEECKLVSPEPRAGNYSITLQSKEEGKIDPTVEPAQPEVAPTEPSSAMQVDDPFQAVEDTGSKATSSLQQVMKHLIAEVLNLAKDRPTEGEDVSAAGSLSLENRLSPVLLILVELLGSYNESKAIMLQPAKRSGKDSAISVKTRSPVLNVLLNHYVCNIVFDADVNRNSGDKVTDAQKERMNVSNWAGAVIVALCSDPSGNSNLRDPTNPIVTVRKTVMDAIAKSIKDASSSTDPLNLRYGRLWALSELCYRLLTARPAIMPKHYDDPSLHIAKIMLEKGFVPLLTAALAEVDLTYPRVKNLITAVVQPLEYLCVLNSTMTPFRS